MEGLTAPQEKKCPMPTSNSEPITCEHHSASQPLKRELPKGLIGPKCTATVRVEGVQCDSLIDSGSQVTTVSKSFRENHLSHQQIFPIQDLLDLEGAGGQEVPYLGYIQISIDLPEDVMGVPERVDTLALVVPDHRSNLHVPVLIGTNVLDPLYEKYALTFSERAAHKSKSRSGSALAKHLYYRFKINQQNGRVGTVKLQSKRCITIPAGQKAVLNGYTRNVPVATETTLLVEPPKSNLPSGLLFCSYIMTSPSRSSFKLPVLVKNEMAHDIRIPAGHMIAEVSLPKAVSALPTNDSNVNTTGKPQSAPNVATCSSLQTSESDQLTFDFTDSPLSEEWKERITKKLNSMSEVFALNDLDYGHTTEVKHRIRLSDPTPFKQRPRPIHPSDYEAVRLHLKELKDANIIRESESPFASPIVVVKKKNGTIRLCVDYRKLNNQTIKDAYALPNIEEAFSSLSGSKWFSIMDLKSGYYQVEVEEQDKYKTAFVTPMGFWEFNRMPQGVTNAPSTFQRVMEKCMGSMNLSEVLVFLDDLIVFSATLEEHEERLLKVLDRLKDFGLKLSPEKCQFFKKSVKYLGHIVSEKGVETDPSKIEALTTWPRPNNIKELKSFLGFSGYYRRFIKDYSKIARPLNDLTAGYIPPKRRCPNTKPFTNTDFKRPFNDKWTTTCEDAFRTLIQKLTTAPILGFADPKKLYVVHTDASLHGLGAALYQEQEGGLRVIAYASRGLSRCERRYPAHKLEFLSLKWAVTEKFFDYLYGARFSVVTDNNPLTYILSSAKLDAAGHRWLAALSSFDFNIQYRAGKKNQDADGLSRRPHQDHDMPDMTSQDEDNRIKQFIAQFLQSHSEPNVPSEAVKALCQAHELHHSSHAESELTNPLVPVECLAIEATALPDAYCRTDMLGSCTLPKMSLEDWAREQRQDPVISRVIDIVRTGRRLTYRQRQQENREVQLMLRVIKQLVLTDKVLHRKRLDQGAPCHQLVLPINFRQQALENLHDSLGHMGVDRTLDLVRARFFWPRMALDVHEKIRTCERCVRRKACAEKSAPLVNIQTSRPLELVCIDYLSLEPDKKGTKNILVITDHFTKYAVAVPTADQKSKTVAKALWNSFFIHYGFPERLHSDQGRDFESTLIKDLCSLLGIKKTRTTPYHPRGNPVERFNRTLLQMLGTLEEGDKTRWKEFVQPLVHAYNCTKNDTTGFSPYQLMFGRQPHLPIDIAFGLNTVRCAKLSHSEYVKKLAESLTESYRLASEHSQKRALQNKQRFDNKVRESTLTAGDRVLVRNVGLRGKHKIADRWSETVYTVVKQIPDLPVYVVVPENAKGPERVLHRDLLLPCGFLPSTTEEINMSTQKPKSMQKESHQTDHVDTEEEMDLSDLEDGIQYYSSCDKPSQVTKDVQTNNEQGDTAQTENETLGAEVSNHAEFQRAFEQSECEGSASSAWNPEATEFQPMSPQEVERIEFTPVHQPVNTVDLPNSSVDAQSDHSSPASQTQNVTKVANEIEQPNQRDANYGIGLRRSTRDRMAPKKLTYPNLGSPLIGVMHSILRGLDQAISDTFTFDPVAINTITI